MFTRGKHETQARHAPLGFRESDTDTGTVRTRIAKLTRCRKRIEWMIVRRQRARPTPTARREPGRASTGSGARRSVGVDENGRPQLHCIALEMKHLHWNRRHAASVCGDNVAQRADPAALVRGDAAYNARPARTTSPPSIVPGSDTRSISRYRRNSARSRFQLAAPFVEGDILTAIRRARSPYPRRTHSPASCD